MATTTRHLRTADTPIHLIGAQLTPRQLDILRHVHAGHVWSAFDAHDADVTIRTTISPRGWKGVNAVMRVLVAAHLAERSGTAWTTTPAGEYVVRRHGGAA